MVRQRPAAAGEAQRKNNNRRSEGGDKRRRVPGDASCSTATNMTAILAVTVIAIVVFTWLALPRTRLHFPPSKASAGVKSDNGPVATDRVHGEERSAREDGGESTEEKKVEVDCREQQERSVALYGKGDVQGAIDALVECSQQNPEHVGSMWNVGVLLARVGEYDNAVTWMHEAAARNRTNVAYHKGLGTTARKAGNAPRAVTAYQDALEILLRLEQGTWEKTLFSSANSAPEDLMWIVDEGPEVLGVLEALLSSYLQARYLRHANAAFMMLSRSNQENRKIQSQYADFLFGIGQFSQGLQVTMEDMMTQYSVQVPDGDAYGTITRESLLLLTAGLDSHVVNMARNFLLVESMKELDLIGHNCGTSLKSLFSSVTVESSQVRDIVAQCIEDQAVIQVLAQKGADVNSANGFGFTPMHHLAAFGSERLLQHLLEAKGDVDAKNTLDQTPLHIAAMRGSPDSIRFLLKHHALKDTKDRFDRTPLDIACMHAWATKEVTKALGASADVCYPGWDKPVHPATPFQHKSVGGGWLESSASKRYLSTCDIDIVENITADEFLIDYLTLQKPLLVRNGLKGSKWDDVRKRWTREKFGKAFGSLIFESVSIPYANAFGIVSNETTVRDHLAYMAEEAEANEQGIQDPQPPKYIFASLLKDMESPLLKDVFIPDFINPTVTEIQTRNVQFFLGPEGSGAPLHFHRGAWNALIYGRKRWFILPPPYAVYSKKHPRDWFSDDYEAVKSQGLLLECVQESGDVMFIPEAWGHGVLNLAESVGYASEFQWGASEFAIEEEDEAEEGH